jgi:hypothetical protein
LLFAFDTFFGVYRLAGSMSKLPAFYEVDDRFVVVLRFSSSFSWPGGERCSRPGARGRWTERASSRSRVTKTMKIHGSSKSFEQRRSRRGARSLISRSTSTAGAVVLQDCLGVLKSR